MNFHETIRNYLKEEGLVIYEANRFMGAIKEVRAKMRDNYYVFKLNGSEILVKSLEQKSSGSAADKIAMFYLNLQESPYDEVLIVADTTTVDMFEPLLSFFKKRQLRLDKVKVMSFDDFKKFVRNNY